MKCGYIINMVLCGDIILNFDNIIYETQEEAQRAIDRYSKSTSTEFRIGCVKK